MRIAVVTTWLPTSGRPSAGTFIARDIAALGADHEVRVLHLVPSRDRGDLLDLPAARHVRSLPLDIRTPAGWIRARKAVRTVTRGADVLHTMAAPALLAASPGGSPVPWVHTEHWSGVVRISRLRPADPRRLVMKGLMGRPDLIVSVSDYLGSAVSVLRRGQSTVIGNIVDAQPVTDERAAWAGDAISLLGVGTVGAHKGWELAVDATAALRQRGVDASLIWLGDGPEHEQLTRAGARIPLTAPGHVPPQAVRDAMRLADVVILPTLGETFSLVTAEALMEGTPVVATGEGAHHDLISPGSGLIVPRDPESLAEGVLQAVRIDRRGVLARGRELAGQYSEARFRTAYGEIYERLKHDE